MRIKCYLHNVRITTGVPIMQHDAHVTAYMLELYKQWEETELEDFPFSIPSGELT